MIYAPKASLKVWHLLSNRWNSAITEYALSAAQCLGASGVHSLFSPLAGSPAEKRAREKGLEVSPFTDFGLSQIGTVRKLTASFKPDVVVCYGGPETFLARFINAKTKVRFRGQAFKKSFIENASQKISTTHIDKILVPGQSLLADCREILPSKTASAVVLGCDTSIFPYRERQKSERPSLLIFGRFDPVKGHREFMDIFSLALTLWPEDLPRPWLHIAGEPANVSESDLHTYARKIGLASQDYTVATGRFADVSSMMADATLGVVSSLGSELICRVAEEFLLCGTAVLVSGAGSLEDVLFGNAGSSYKGLNTRDAAVILVQQLKTRFLETEETRKKRASDAAALFSLSVMAKNLREILT